MSLDQNSAKLLWQPGEKFINHSNLIRYMEWLKEKKDLDFAGYRELWQWSVDNVEEFWRTVWDYFEVISHSPYQSVLSQKTMPGAKWFEGATLNYAEHIFRNKNDDFPAIIFQSEKHTYREISWLELESDVASVSTFLRKAGIKKGDRIAAYLPNIPEATVAFLATCSLGSVWSSCSPDFGVNSVVERFQQIEPKILFAVDGYSYNGKSFDKREVVEAICRKLPSLEKIVFIKYDDKYAAPPELENVVNWDDLLQQQEKLSFEPVEFSHPIWILYSSGTTGIPKAITHGHGGVLLEHLKYLHFHNDVHPGERFFWFSTTGWMMWNFVQASMLVGATIVLYDGSPGYPDLNVLWEFTEKAKIHHFGTSAPFLVANMKAGLKPSQENDLNHLRSIGSTGSPLPPEAFDWVYKEIGQDIWLCSMAGGTDVCTAWVGGCPTLPLYEGEIQCRCLGASLYAFDEDGKPVMEEVGEMVITKPMPSMPVFFWNDENNERYLSSYFEMYPGIWRHGDWLKITERESVIIYGRSDATLNRQGVRIGTAEIYRAINMVDEVKDSLILNIELSGGRDYMPLFIVLNEDEKLTPELKKKIAGILRSEYSPRHVPDEILEIEEVPYTISGKKMEAPVKKILRGIPLEKAATKDSMKNPDSLNFFLRFREKVEEMEAKGG